MAQSTATADPSRQPPPTLLTHLQYLTNPALALPPAYLHPYAPLPGNRGTAGWKDKGKGKASTLQSVESQLEAVRAMRVCVEQAKERLVAREGDWGKLSRALKEVVTHQSVLLPLSTALNPACLRPTTSTLAQLPSSRISLPPVQLLPRLAESLGIETYHEDSQFGLLKATLTLAGNCFVVDIDLETDGAADEDDGGAGAGGAGSSAAPTPTPTTTRGGGDGGEAGSVRLSKIAVSYVTPSRGMEASEYIAGVLRSAVEAYLEEWNSVVYGLREKGERGKRLERCVRRMEGLLGEMKALDGGVQVEAGAGSGEQGSGVEGEEAGFAGLEEVAKRVERLKSGERPIYSAPERTICPSFCLFPPSKTDTPAQNPILRFRPAQPSEDVPIPFEVIQPGEEASGGPATKWLLEVLPGSASSGVVVRKNWLGGPAGTSDPWNGAIKVENLLYTPVSVAGSSQSAVNPFPYQSTFIHQPHPQTVDPTRALDQHWSSAGPGPDGYLVGRLGVSANDEELVRVFDALRRQIQLNRMFLRIFNAQAVLDPVEGGMARDDEGEDMEDLLAGKSLSLAHHNGAELTDAEPTAIPITASQVPDGIILESPLPHTDQPGLALRLRVSLGLEDPERFSVTHEILGQGAPEGVEAEVASALEKVGEGGDLVEVFRAVEGSIKVAMHA